jgi:hypothetical protein
MDTRPLTGLQPITRTDAAFLQNAWGMSGKVPRALPWAGMRCPFGTRSTLDVSCPKGLLWNEEWKMENVATTWALLVVGATLMVTPFSLSGCQVTQNH